MGKITWVWRPCKACGVVFHRDEFVQFKGSNGVYYPRPYCAACWPSVNARQAAAWRRRHPGKNKESSRLLRRDHPELQERYEFKRRCKALGLPFEPLWGLWQLHNKRCDVCGEPETDRAHNRLSIDHDHATGLFRGFICNRHNRGIGLIGDTLEAAEQVVVYLKSASLRRDMDRG